MFDDIKRALPNIPDELIRLWIVPLAEHPSNGWAPTDDNRWDKRVTGELFTFWNDAEWELQSLDMTRIPFARGYHDSMQGLHDAYNLGTPNAYWQLLGEDGKRRYYRCFSYILRNRIFPQPPVLALDEVGRYQLIDGNHRFLGYVSAHKASSDYENASDDAKAEMAAALGGPALPPFAEQQVWVCRPNWANSPSAQSRQALRNSGLGALVD